MSIYSKALKAYLDRPGALNQSDLAEKASCTQAAISRYSTGDRFPDAETARRIHDATDGDVDFDQWREVAAKRAGLAA